VLRLALPEPHCMNTSPALLVLIGPSATGKSTLARALADRGLVTLVPTWTTRPRRSDEPGDTAEHRFVDTAGFNRLRAERALLAEARLPGLPYRYGLPRLDGLTGIALVIARAEQIDLLAAASGLVPVVYQVCAPIQQVAARLAERGTTPAEREFRLARFHAERVAGVQVSDRCFLNNGQITDLVSTVSQALVADFETGGNHDRQPSHATAVA
jgi:guanylate kinase